jgi:hypothetical protein
VDEGSGGHQATSGADELEGEAVAVRFRWRAIGDVGLDNARKLVFPQAAHEPGVYRFEVDGGEASVYFGEAGDLHRRFQRYRNADRSMQTNLRLREQLTGVLVGGGRCRVSIAEVVSFHARTRAAELDLRLKAARVLIESAAIVMARNDGVRAVLNLDKAFDRALGGD